MLKIIKYISVLIVLLLPINAQTQTWKVEGLTAKNLGLITNTIRTFDEVSDIKVDLQNKTMTLIPKPRALIDSNKLASALSQIKGVRLGAKLSPSIPTPKEPPVIPPEIPRDKVITDTGPTVP